MKRVDVEIKLNKTERAFERLKESISRVEDDLHRDGVIQRFEFTIELLWKAIKAILEYKMIECFSPRDCIKSAFRHGLINDDEVILDMLDDRNIASHIYDEKIAEKVFNRIKEVYISNLERILEGLKEKV